MADMDDYSKKLADQANAYRKNLPGLQQQQFQVAEDTGKRDLAEQMGNTRKRSQQRGLLYSGLRQGQEVGDISNYSRKLSDEQARINQATNKTADTMENDAFNAGLKNSQSQLAASDLAYQRALAERAQKGQALGSLGGGIGSIVGSFLGGGK